MALHVVMTGTPPAEDSVLPQRLGPQGRWRGLRRSRCTHAICGSEAPKPSHDGLPVWRWEVSRQAASRHDGGRRARTLLERYYGEYRAWAAEDPSQLNRKVPREAFDELLNRAGALLLEQAAVLATTPGPVREFLEQNPLPLSLAGKLPDEFRAFTLALNALKQWVAAEQAATDRYLLGRR